MDVFQSNLIQKALQYMKSIPFKIVKDLVKLFFIVAIDSCISSPAVEFKRLTLLHSPPQSLCILEVNEIFSKYFANYYKITLRNILKISH